MKVHAPILFSRTSEHHHWCVYRHVGFHSYQLVADAIRQRGPGKTAPLSRWIIRWFGDYRSWTVVN